MYQTFNHLPDLNQQEQLNHLARIITDFLDVNAIIYIGSLTTKTVIKSCFVHGGMEGRYRYEYNLLVIPRSGETREDYELQDLIESRCRSFARVNATVRGSEAILDLFRKGCDFFGTVFHSGCLLYRSDQWVIPSAPEQPEDRAMKAGQDWDLFYGDASGFLAGAEFYAGTGALRHAVFLLHQAAERICSAMIRVFTGLHTSTHNLSKLLQYTRLFSMEPSAIFPRNTPEEIRLYNLLFKGYSDARYRQSYRINENELHILIDRIRQLLQIAQRLCTGQLKRYKLPAQVTG